MLSGLEQGHTFTIGHGSDAVSVALVTFRQRSADTLLYRYAWTPGVARSIDTLRDHHSASVITAVTRSTDSGWCPPTELGAEEFLEPMGITEYRLARAIGVPQTRISAITHGRRCISADTGLRLPRYFGMSEGFWTG